MRIRKSDIVELCIDRVAYGGKGIARMDGLVVFVKGTVPGDRVMARIVRKKKDYAEAKLEELLDPSTDRINAPCPYSGYCGGCSFQHLRYEKQLDYKKGHIIDSIARIGAVDNVLVHDVIPSDRIYGYRNKMEFSFSDRCWLPAEEYAKGEREGGFGLGLHMPGTFFKVMDIDACLLQHDAGNLILNEVKRYVKESGVPVYGLKGHRGFWRFLTLRYSTAFDEWLVNLVTSEEDRGVVMPLSEILSKSFNRIKTVVNNINTKKAAIASGEREIILTGEGYIRDRIGPHTFQVSANSFFQTNSSGAGRLYEKVVEYAELEGHEVVLDLYCGTGTIPIFLSKKAKEVIGMEIVGAALQDAERNCISNDVLNCRFILGDIRETLPHIRFKPDVLIIDPPRAGIHEDILKNIMSMAAKKVVYVSCNPATMARDIGRMSDRYLVKEIQPVDMFPHTYHIEAVVKMVLQ